MTLPSLNVWHDHDGSSECPLPVGTVHDYDHVISGVWAKSKVAPREDWLLVTRYRVVSYPEGTQHD